MKAIVTGGGGFVGLAIVKQLVARGIETAVVGRHLYPSVEKLGCKIFCGDIRDLNFLNNAFSGHDIVFHTAAKAGIWGKKDEYFSVNTSGTRNVITACADKTVKTLVYTSTPSVVFNSQDINGADESLPYSSRFLCYYAESKTAAEKMIIAANSEKLKTCALRPHLIWGPGDPHLVPRLLERGRAGKLRQVGLGNNLVDISYIDNVAEAHLLAAENLNSTSTAAGQSYFISQGEPVNLWKWINTLFERLNVPRMRKSVSFKTAYRAGGLFEIIYKMLHIGKEPRMTRFLAEQLAKSHYFSIKKATEDLGYIPKITTHEGMNHLVAWLQKKSAT